MAAERAGVDCAVVEFVLLFDGELAVLTRADVLRVADVGVLKGGYYLIDLPDEICFCHRDRVIDENPPR